ncbi:MAG: sodium-translocating pyrophosphatase [archaeon GB-1867-097]|nr:sodium-translocating pyrophosphatase [Candidatus Culexmicrobium thermophilum]HDO21049.1 sodium-translocating pyrophosphatase [Candidatus Bathyarchaeota archaeon]
MDLLLFAILCSILSILTALFMQFYVSKLDEGSPRMREIADAIKEGADAYLKRQYKTLAIFVLTVAFLIAVFLDPNIGLTYIVGSFCSGLAGFLGMAAALRANSRTANAAKSSIVQAFKVAFSGGAVMGLSVVGMALLGISVLYYIYHDLNVILGFSFGASAVALFAKAGGGIFTKTADIAADLVGKVEMGIPEDDPRNPAVIADNVGDNVGDVAGMGADLFDSYVGSVIAAMVLGYAYYGSSGIFLSLSYATAGIIASIIGALIVREIKVENPGFALNLGTLTTGGLFLIFSYMATISLNFDLNIFYSNLVGLVAGVLIGLTTDYYTAIDKTPVLKIAEMSKTGSALNILSGFSYGLLSVVPPIIGISAATILAWHFGGLFGIGVAALGMLSITGMIVSSDAYGPIVDNAKGIAEQAGLSDEVISRTDVLDAVGNTAKAITKGFAIGAAALTVLALFSAYAEIVNLSTLDLMNPFVIAGVFIGAMMPPLFSALTILGVCKNAFRMIEEVRRQFRENPGILEGKVKPDYARCVDIATIGALKELMPPGILAIIVPLMVGLFLGKDALGGLLAGSIVTGFILAILMANSGGAWDNAKKYIEAGHLGGPGSEAHKSAVVGDTVGDPFKDTAGPSLNTLITVMSLVASVFAPLIVSFSLLGF